LACVVPLHDHLLVEVTKNLTRIRDAISNQGASPDALGIYQDWANQAAESLGYMFSPADIEYLIQTPRHWVLIATTLAGNRPTINGMLSVERTERLRVFDALIKQYRGYEHDWKDVTARVVAADTNFYLHHERDFIHADWPTITGSDSVRLLVPMQVVRELDKK
jgi:hypothetical protein